MTVISLFIIGSILNSLIGLNPFYEFKSASGQSFVTNFFYTVHNNPYIFEKQLIYRQTFFFDEPGTAAFFIGIGLFINRILNVSKNYDYFFLILDHLLFLYIFLYFIFYIILFSFNHFLKFLILFF